MRAFLTVLGTVLLEATAATAFGSLWLVGNQPLQKALQAAGTFGLVFLVLDCFIGIIVLLWWSLEG